MDLSIGRVSLFLGTSFCVLLSCGSAPAQHLNLEPLASVADASLGNIDFQDAAEPLPKGLSLRDSEDLVAQKRRGVAVDNRLSYQNWVAVTALGVCFTFGLVMTVTVIRRHPSESPHRIL